MKSPGVRNAFLAALLFGASAPFAKFLLGELPPVVLAGALYMGSGLGLAWWRWWRRKQPDVAQEAPLRAADWPWLGGAIIAGGVLAPVMLMLGLGHTPASTTSLLLNLEGVLTAGLAWFVFKENFDRRIAAGMVAIVAGGVLLSWNTDGGNGGALRFSWAALLIVGACLGWAVDNNLTRMVSGADPAQIAMYKGLAAGTVNLGIGWAMLGHLPAFSWLLAAGVLGLLSYGISLTLFVLALRDLGSARTGAYYSVAPLIGVVLSLLVLREVPNILFWPALLLMGIGVWLHLTEHHAHEHTHEPMEHEHRHVHDEHHQHAHRPGDPEGESHSHPHQHGPMTHTHPHTPDLHHRHKA